MAEEIIKDDLLDEETVDVTEEEAPAVLTQGEITRESVDAYIEYTRRLTGVKINREQARMLMFAAVAVPMRTLSEIADRNELGVDEISVNLPYGKVYFSYSQAKTGEVGNLTGMVDEEGNPILKGRVKVSISSKLVAESNVLAGWEDERTLETVENHRANEEENLEAYEVNTTRNLSDELAEILRVATVNFLDKKVPGVDLNLLFSGYTHHVELQKSVDDKTGEVVLPEEVVEEEVIPPTPENGTETKEEFLEDELVEDEILSDL